MSDHGNGIRGGGRRLEASSDGGAHPFLVSKLYNRAFGPETLISLQQIYDECLKELVTVFAVTDASELHGIQDQVALRIISCFEEGMTDAKEIQDLTLHGLRLDWRVPLSVRR
jgi:hypothetical protein